MHCFLQVSVRRLIIQKIVHMISNEGKSKSVAVFRESVGSVNR